MYDYSTILSTIKEFNQLRRESQRFSSSLSRYTHYTVAQFILEYNTNGLKGKPVYDKLMKIIAPEEFLSEVKIKVEPKVIERYSIEDLLTHKKREIPYVSNMHESVGKLMDSAISQAIEILENNSCNKPSVNNGKALRLFFYDHFSLEKIGKQIGCSKENVRANLIGKLITGEKYVEGIALSEDFKQKAKGLMTSLLYHACDTAFEDNDLDTEEKIKFAISLSGYSLIDDMKEWGNAKILVEDSTINLTRQHLISLRKAICDAIVPVSLTTLCDETKVDFITKNEPADFNKQIIISFVQSHPWIEKDEEERYYIRIPHLKNIYQRQGRIIYEAGGLIHHDEVRTLYKSIYGEDYKTPGIQNSLSRRIQNDFFPYGKTGQWYYSESGAQLKPVNKVLSDFVENHVCFYWSDLKDVVTQLCRVDPNLSKRRIRMEVTNLCYVDKNDKDHFVKKGKEDNYASFFWNKGKQNRTNWCVNHVYEMLKDAPNGEMKWADFESQFKQDLLETGRPMKVLEDIKYKHSGTVDDGRIFIRENDTIRINDDVVETEYNGDLSMFGIYRKYPEFYSVIFSLAMTELRKRQDNQMFLVDFIALALDSIESEGKVNSRFIRNVFEDNDMLPKGLSRYNENGSVLIKYDPAIAEEETDDNLQYVVASEASDDVQTTPQLKVAEEKRQPVTYTTRFAWDDVKKALKADLAFYESPFWYPGITSDQVLDKFINVLSSSENINLNQMLPQIIYEFHYARIDRYDHIQYIRNLPIAFEALLREIYESCHRPTYSKGIYQLCEEGFPDYAQSIKFRDRRGFGRILNDLVHKRNLLLHGMNLELSPVTLVQNIVEYLALFVYTVNEYSLNV